MKMRNNNQNKKSEYTPLSAEKKKLLFTIAINSVLLSAIYFGACYGITDQFLHPISYIVTIGFWAAFAGFLMAYVIYNRAFSRKDLTVDMLPRDWSAERRAEYIEDGKRRLKKSRWMLSVIIPIAVPIALDALYLFTLPLIQNLLGITPK